MLPGVNINRFTKLIQLIGSASFIVTEIVEVNQYAQLMKCFDAIHHVNRAAIICRPWHIQTHDMKVTIHSDKIDP